MGYLIKRKNDHPNSTVKEKGGNPPISHKETITAAYGVMVFQVYRLNSREKKLRFFFRGTGTGFTVSAAGFSVGSGAGSGTGSGAGEDGENIEVKNARMPAITRRKKDTTAYFIRKRSFSV